MTTPSADHEWLVANCCCADENAANGIWADFRIDAHRNRRGPYTAAGGFIRAVIDHALSVVPDLVATHLLTTLSLAPEIGGKFDVPADVQEASALSREGNPSSWTRRLANGAVDFILGYFEGECAGRAVIFTNVDQADPTDQEFLIVLLRRADPARLRICVCTTSDRPSAPLALALERYANRRQSSRIADAPAVWGTWLAARGLSDEAATRLWCDLSAHGHEFQSPPDSGSLDAFLDQYVENLSGFDRNILANSYVNADGTSHRMLARHAYRRLPVLERRAMHLARAASLASLGEASLALGAIPFHNEQAGEDAETLLTAARSCLDKAWYEAALDWSVRGRRMLALAPWGVTYADLTRTMLFALLLLGRYDELAALCEDLLARSQDSGPEDSGLLAHATYAMAILNARLYERSRRDYDAAKSWIEKSQKFSEGTPASPIRTVNAAFLMNTLALVEMRKGDADAAQRKLVEALELIATAAPELYRTESVILLHNLARLHVATGHADMAVVHLDKLLSQQPGDSAAWFDRGLIHQRAGRYEAALGDYDGAIRWEPAHAEATFNRARVLVALNRCDEAIAGYGRVTVLQPDNVDALLNRALLSRERGDHVSAASDVSQALEYQPGNSQVLCLHGLIELKAGRDDVAWNAFTQSIEADPSLADPWANRAIIAVRRGDRRAALDDLTQALARREDAKILYNRGRVFEAERQWQEASDDYARALTLEGGNTDAINDGYRRCHEALGKSA